MFNKQPIFIFTTGRSGSTWLQRILNVHPKVCIWGEHHGFIEDLANSYFKIIDANPTWIPARENKVAYEANITTAKDSKLASKLIHPFPQNRKNIIGPLRDPNLAIEWLSPFSHELLTEHYKNFLGAIFAHQLPVDIRWGF